MIAASTRPQQDLHQQARRPAGHLRPSRQLRHRLRRGGASNTLDLNYLALAERHKARDPAAAPRDRHRADHGGYRVDFDHIDRGKRKPGADRPAGGRSGRFAGLDRAAAALPGRGEHLAAAEPAPRPATGAATAISSRRRSTRPRGRSESGADHHQRHRLPRRQRGGASFWIEDGGFPNVLANWLTHATAADARVQTSFLDVRPCRVLRPRPPGERDALVRPGHRRRQRPFELKRRWWFAGDAPPRSRLGHREVGGGDRGDRRHAQGARQGDRRQGPGAADLERRSYPDHAASAGRVQHGRRRRRAASSTTRARSFGYRNLFVIDGAMVPEALGVNPSRRLPPWPSVRWG